MRRKVFFRVWMLITSLLLMEQNIYSHASPTHREARSEPRPDPRPTAAQQQPIKNPHGKTSLQKYAREKLHVSIFTARLRHLSLPDLQALSPTRPAATAARAARAAAMTPEHGSCTRTIEYKNLDKPARNAAGVERNRSRYSSRHIQGRRKQGCQSRSFTQN